MSKEFVIAVDIDGVLIRTDLTWTEWLEKVCGVRLHNTKGSLDYDLTKYFKEELIYQGLTGFEYWEQADVYENLMPVEGSVAALESLYEEGATIVALSRAMGNHHGSKARWVEKYYPFIEDTILVGHGNSKARILCDVIIEDHLPNLANFPSHVRGIILDNPYIKPCPTKCHYTIEKDWDEVYTAVSTYMKGRV